MKRKHWIALLSIALALLVAGGSVTAWLLTRTPPDTDPNAPFEDLSQWEKRQILRAVEKAYQKPGNDVFWYREPNRVYEEMYAKYYKSHGVRYDEVYGIQYYGTFGGYRIILYPIESMWRWPMHKRIGEYGFEYQDSFVLFAYKKGEVVELSQLYKDGRITDEQLEKIHQCYERYHQQIYFLPRPKVEK